MFYCFRIEFMSDKKSLGAGKKRCITFTNGNSDQETIVSEGFLKNNLIVSVSHGLPNDSRKYHKFLSFSNV